MADKSKIPTIVLAGRPNAGKSTLFNRLLRKRKAITDPTPGVTRDPIEADYIIGDIRFRLIDTGGYKLTDCDEMDKLVVAKTMETIKKADIVVLLIDAGNITSEDEEIIERLRPYISKLIVAVNKTEGGRKLSDAWNVLKYGFDKILMISAEHGDNIGDLQQEILARYGVEKAKNQGEEDRADNSLNNTPVKNEPVIRIALLGKPNTGKSTLSNRLTGTNASIVSDIPGTTRDTVEGFFNWKKYKFSIIDTAGIRRKTKVTENIEYYSVNRAIKAVDDADIVMLMIDAEEGLTDQDKKIARLAHDKGRGIIFVLNKWDALIAADGGKITSSQLKPEPSGTRSNASGRHKMPNEKYIFKKVRDRIKFLFAKMEYAPIIPVSAKTGFGVDNLLSAAVKMYSQLNIQITTGVLNQMLEQWTAENPPPTGPRTRFKIKYAVQKSANPVRFIFFVSRIKSVNEAYISYIRNKIRKDLGFSLIPVLIDIKNSS